MSSKPGIRYCYCRNCNEDLWHEFLEYRDHPIFEQNRKPKKLFRKQRYRILVCPYCGCQRDDPKD